MPIDRELLEVYAVVLEDYAKQMKVLSTTFTYNATKMAEVEYLAKRIKTINDSLQRLVK